MRPTPPSAHDESDAAGLVLGGKSRLTRQRREVYEVLLGERDHPTATEVFLRVKARVPTISLATVYNCLETLTQAGFVQQVNLDRAPSRYCPNTREHGHFYCEQCSRVTDVEFNGAPCSNGTLQLPRGAIVQHVDISLKGLCPECAGHQEKAVPASPASLPPKRKG